MTAILGSSYNYSVTNTLLITNCVMYNLYIIDFFWKMAHFQRLLTMKVKLHLT